MPHDKPLKSIGVADQTSAGWAAGASFTSMLVHSLGAACEAAGVELTLFTPTPDSHNYGPTRRVVQLNSNRQARGVRSLRKLLGSSEHARPLPGETRLRHALSLNDGSDLFLAAKKHGVSVLVPLLDVPPWKLPYATIGWVPDFQHVYLPQLFSEAEKIRRDQTIQRVAEWSTRIMLSSQAAFDHFRAFAPAHAGKAQVIPFPSLFCFNPPTGDARETQRRFHLPQKFALLANQFWTHKNHLAVIEALGELRRHDVTIPLVMIGRPSDNKDPHNRNLSGILQAIASRGLSDQVFVLGEVSFQDMINLMRTAAVVIQPSRFEGWSTIVQDAKALGRPLLCSDIQVHREQAPQALGFFACDQPEQLAALLAEHWPRLKAGPDQAGENAALATEAAFARRHGEMLLDLCRQACAQPLRASVS